MTTDELIRRALSLQADRAPDEDTVLAAFESAGHQPQGRQWNRRGVLIAATAGVVIAVGVPTTIVANGGNPFGSSAPSSDCESASQPAGESRGTPLPYAPTWLPDDLIEAFRSASLARPPLEHENGLLMWREWQLATGDTGSVSFAVTRSTGALPDGEPVVINDHDGVVTDRGDVLWKPEPTLTFDVSVTLPGAMLSTNTKTALRVARSVEPDECTTLESIGSFGWLPPQLQPATERTGSFDGSWAGTELIARAGDGPIEQLKATIHPGPPTPFEDGPVPTEIAVRGTVGEYYADRSGNASISVDLGQGRSLYLQFGGADDAGWAPTEAELIRIADELVIGPTPDYDWLGR